MTLPWTKAGALYAPPKAPLGTLRAVAERVGDDLDTVAPVVGAGRFKGWRALPRELATPRGVRVVDATRQPHAPPLRLARGFRPRDYQAPAVDAWLRQPQGAIEAPCGAGKTTMGLVCIARSPTPALVLVHRLDLAHQWRDEARVKLGAVAELLTGPGHRARLAIATFQQLQTWTPAQLAELGEGYGLIVVDEAHHVPARTWAAVLRELPARRRLALTATPEREDGRTPLLYAHVGPLRWAVPIRHLQTIGATLKPVVRVVRTRWSCKGDRADKVTTARARNALIVRQVEALAAEGRRVLVLADRVGHVERLAAAIGRAGVAASTVHGELTPAERSTRLGALRAGVLSCLTATSVADEGLDLPELDSVILATPGAALGRVQQRIGRSLRPGAAKLTPIILDLVDPGTEDDLARRLALYRSLDWTVEGA